MDNVKKVVMGIITAAGAIYGLYEFYKEYESRIKEIVGPLLEACKDIKDIDLKKL